MPQPRKPTRLAAIEGGRGRSSRANKRAAAAAPVSEHLAVGSPPSWLDREAEAEWRRIVSYADGWPGWLETADRSLLAQYCVWHSVFVSAARTVAEQGPLVPGRSSADQARGDVGLVKNRAVSVMTDATTQLRQLAAALGLSAWHRSRVDRTPADAGSEAEDLLS